jgi:sugar phosphate isomerase/epimerase
VSLALSTSWNAFKHTTGKKIIQEIKDTGFSRIELSFSLTPQIIQDIINIKDKEKIEIVSAHNYCPIPYDVSREFALPDCYSLASLDEEERKRAVYFTKKSIECCAELKAKVLVLHSGRVKMETNMRSLLNLYSIAGKENQQFKEIKDKMQKEREEKKSEHLSCALKSLEELDKYAQKFEIILGLENRFYFEEIPSFDEIDIFLSNFKDGNIFYWHDTGHAQVLENLGLIDSAYDFLKRYGKRLCGIHLHDVRGFRDHLAPLKGELDFAGFKPYLTDSTIKVLEVHYPATSKEIVKAKKYLEKTLL